VPSPGAENVHVITADHVIYHFTPDMEPKWRVPSGADVEIHCVDGLGGTIRTESDLYVAVDYDHVNDATGPIYVDGAEPGDILAFRIDEIRVASDQGCTLLIPGFGLHGEQVGTARTRISQIADESVVVLGRFEVPLRPMLGTIGVAPREGRWDTVTPHDHGGNLDTSDVRAGVQVLFPVSQPGALLAMGDAKAVMSDGEVCSTGVEVPVVVRGRLQVLRGRLIDRPMIETETEWMTVGSAKDYLDACRLANGDMVGLLAEANDLSWEDAYMLSSVVADLRVSQVVDPLLTVRCCAPKGYVNTLFDDLPQVGDPGPRRGSN
jgi:amidase